MTGFGVAANIVAACLGAATLAAALAPPKAWRAVNVAAWAFTVLGFVALQFFGADAGFVTATAAAAGLATLRCATVDASRRRRILGFGAAVPIAVAIVGIAGVGDVTSPWGEQVVLYTAAWAALVAGLSGLMAAAALARRPAGPGLGIAAAGAALAVVVAGTGRSSLGDAFYGFPLSTEEGPLRWVVPPTPGFEEGIRLAVAAPLPSVLWLLGAVAAAALVAGGLTWTKFHKLRAACWAACGAAAAGLLGSLQPTVAGIAMPKETPYVEHVERLFLVKNIPGGATDTGAWSSGAEVFVATAHLAPEIFAMVLVAVIALVAAYLAFRPGALSHDALDPMFARDHAARGLGFTWIAWFVSAIVHDALYGSPGVGAPGEWALLGVLLGGTGLLLVSWHRENQLLRVLGELTAGLVVAALLIVAGFAWRFGALPAFSIGVF